MHSKSTLPLLPCLLLSVLATAQIGVNAGYRWNDAPGWTERSPGATDGVELLADGYSAGVDYWFRLKSVRLEFLPELNYGRYRQELEDGRETDLRTYSFFFNVNIYPFDFFSDCDCPTFSKQNDFFRRGFFLQLSPGVSYLDERAQTLRLDAEQGLTSNALEDSQVAFSLGAALGFDIGLSDLLTITPTVGLRYFPSATWNTLAEFPVDPDQAAVENTETRLLQMGTGLRLGFRFGE